MLKKFIFCMSFVFMVVSLFSMEKNDLNHNSQMILNKIVDYFKASSTTQGFSTEAWKSLSPGINNLDGRHIRDIGRLLKKSNDVNGFLTHVGVAMISHEIDNRAALMRFFDRLVSVALTSYPKKDCAGDLLVKSDSEKFLTFQELCEFFEECNKKRAVFLKEKMDELHTCKTTCAHYFEQIKIFLDSFIDY